jgi:predicted nucleic acid-binding protein
MSDALGQRAGREPADTVREMLAITHRTHASAPLRLPSEQGVFPDARIAQPLCVILDAHWLGFDLNYACARNQRTALVTAANQQLIRLFCAQHVADEIVEHVEAWSINARRSVPVADFLRRWHREYLPMLRVVPDDAVPKAWLTEDERARIAILAKKDTDDIPSVKLALAIRGMYVSKDGPAVRAVYGEGADLIDRERWLDHLKAGSDAGELALLVHGNHVVAGLAGMGVFKATQKVYDTFGPVGFLLAGGVGLLLSDWIRQPERQGLRSALGEIFMLVMEMELQRGTQQEVFDKSLPDVPNWSTLAAANTPESAVGRAALYTLAREMRAHISAQELTEALRTHLPCGEATVRRLLRGTSCFEEVNRGRWQVGAAQRRPEFATCSGPPHPLTRSDD